MAPSDLFHNGSLELNDANATDSSTMDNDVMSYLSHHVLAIFTRQYEDHFLLALNICALIIFVMDKRRAQEGGWRVREVFLYICCLNAPFASISAMLIAWHKVRKPSFYLVVTIGLFLTYQSYGFIADEGMSWWKVFGFINIALTFITLVCEC